MAVPVLRAVTVEGDPSKVREIEPTRRVHECVRVGDEPGAR